ncbi:hypothetical protein PAE1560 [Pyrobaculum aerophilum str. IM2]|uniref:Uncharacterized protein n=2 Tax=Pyrobaculum aerophilum TaxID=13773 RepID=Q8ZWY5_PYRAE|nr:hypothetical protein PAE1560 [Pyrobaculum aerophilum str. IM2]
MNQRSPRRENGELRLALKKPAEPMAMDIIAIMRGPGPGLYYVATSPPHCGVLKLRLAELPTNLEPPFRATYLKTRHGTALINITRIDLDQFLLDHYEHLIEGEVEAGVLRGVVCNKEITAKVLDKSITGPVLAAVPVTKGRKIPHIIPTLLAYKLQIT